MPTLTKCCENVQFGWRPPVEGDPELPEGENILFCVSCGTDWGPGITESVASQDIPSPLPPVAAGDDMQPAIIARLDAILLNLGSTKIPVVGSGGGGATSGDGVYQQAWINVLDGLDSKASWGKNMLREYLLGCLVDAGGEGGTSGDGDVGDDGDADESSGDE